MNNNTKKLENILTYEATKLLHIHNIKINQIKNIKNIDTVEFLDQIKILTNFDILSADMSLFLETYLNLIYKSNFKKDKIKTLFWVVFRNLLINNIFNK